MRSELSANFATLVHWQVMVDPAIRQWLALRGHAATPNLIVLGEDATHHLDVVENKCPWSRRYMWGELAAACGRNLRLAYAEAETIEDPWSDAVVTAAQHSALLIIDDFGANVSGPYEVLGLARLVRFRGEYKLPIAVSTRYSETELADQLSATDDLAQQGQLIASVLYGGATVVS